MKSCKQCGDLFYGRESDFCSDNHRNKWNWIKHKYGDELENHKRILVTWKHANSKVRDELIKMILRLSGKTKTVMSKF